MRAVRKITSFTTLFLILLLLSLFNCEKWETEGTVALDRLISFEELWQNRDAYKGKVITLQWGPEDLGGGTGSPPPIDGITYGYVNHFIDFDKDASMSVDYFNKNIRPKKLTKALNTSDSIQEKRYEVQIIYSAVIDGIIQLTDIPMPSWISPTNKILPYSPTIDVKIFGVEDTKTKQLTGILINTFLQKNAAGTKIPCFTIMPLGYRIQK